VPAAVRIACGVMAATVALSMACSGEQKYPVCKSDADCSRTTSNKAHDEYCVFGKCQQCAADPHCPPGEACLSGRCGAPPPPADAGPAAADAGPTTAAAPPRCAPTATVAFDFNSAELRDDVRRVLDGTSRCLQAHHDQTLVIEGHCDERGTTEFNLALGERRAHVIRDYLTRLGVPLARIRTVSYGEEQPVDARASESAWAANRRGVLQVAASAGVTN
jgi:peptidoglycan-associated lipoprotein